MNFVHFGFVIAGAAAMTLPIWIHLLLRQRAWPMDIGSIRFVRDVVRRTKARQRIQRWLLLALRAIAVLLLGLLFARPFFPDVPADGSTREIAVLIDRSSSMSAKHEDGKTAFELARERARKYLSTLGEATRFHIGLFDAAGVELISLDGLAGATPAATGTRYDEALSWAVDVLGNSDRRDRSLLLLSDLQRSGIGKASSGRAFPPDVPVLIEDPAPAVAQNLAIESVLPTQVELRPGIPVSVSVSIYNSGAFPITGIPLLVRLEGPGGEVKATKTLSIAAGSRQTVPLTLEVTAAGIYQGYAVIDREDPMSWDNRRFVAFQVRHPDRVLLIDGDPGRNSWESSTYFVETALRLQAPVGGGPARTFEVERLVWDRGSGFPDLAGYRLIVLANLGRFTEADAARLQSFVEAGGNALWFVGERTTPAVLETLIRSKLFENASFDSAIDTVAHGWQFDKDHPLFAPFADLQHGDLRSLRVRRLMPIRQLGPDTEVLLRSRRWPLIVSSGIGEGRLVMVATSADRSWSDWPQNRLFVPLVRQLAAWLTGQLDLKQPVLTKIINSAELSPGIESDGTAVIVSNIEPGESDIRRLGVVQFRSAFGLSELGKSIEDEEFQRITPAGISRSDEKWPVLVWALLGILGLELLLASRVHE